MHIEPASKHVYINATFFFFLTRTNNQQIKIHTALISFDDNLTGCTLLQSKLAMRSLTKKTQEHYLKQCIFCTVCLWGPLPMITTIIINEWLWRLYAREGHFRHKSQICVRVWVFFVSYPNGKGIRGKRFRFRFQRSENCYPFFISKGVSPLHQGPENGG